LPKAGERANGDSAFLRVEEAAALFGVIDGLGHGPGAEAVSLAAKTCLDSIPLEWSLSRIMGQLHSELGGSRGAAATVCLLRGMELEACAVGNVELRSGDLRFPLVYSAGILGVNVRQFRVCSAKLDRPARFVAFFGRNLHACEHGRRAPVDTRGRVSFYHAEVPARQRRRDRAGGRPGVSSMEDDFNGIPIIKFWSSCSSHCRET
jgi:hypothetical protein